MMTDSQRLLPKGYAPTADETGAEPAPMHPAADSPQGRKLKAVALLRRRLTPDVLARLGDVDGRLREYFEDLRDHSGVLKGDPDDRHNYYEVLSGVKFLRLLATYRFDTRKVRRVIRLRDGEWRRDGRRWVHVSGGLAQETGEHYRWLPFQVYILASVFGFRTQVDTGVAEGTRGLLPTETARGGTIWDDRRLCTDFTFYAPRKNDKTGMSAFIQVENFLLEDPNSESYCVANSADQANRLFERTRYMVQQLDPTGQRIRQTATVCDWKPSYQHVRNSVIRPLTAGPKSKDGLKASLACVDEYGSAAYTRGKSDMQQLLDVVQSSMVSRREPLLFTTTTAGRIKDGPFIGKLAALHMLLERELDPAATSDPTGDRVLCLCLEPDQWERDEEYLLTSRPLRRKVCPCLGVIAQQSFYDDYAMQARTDPSKLTEYVTKNMNVYRSEQAQEWLTPEEVRALQVAGRVDDCKAADGWVVFVGMDFSLGDDLHAMSYLCYNRRDGRFFADCDAWMTERAMRQHPMHEVLDSWRRDGWLGLSPGETLQPELPVGRVAELFERQGIQFGSFLYDPYKAKTVTNALAAYFYAWFARRGQQLDPSRLIMPCRQNYATFNPLVGELDYMVKSTPPLIRFSQSPLWPWEAGNMVLDTSTDGMENRKPRKRDASSKIDNYVALLEALAGYDRANSQEQPAA